MAQEVGHVNQRHVLVDEQAGEGVPLRYNYDKPEKPRRIKGFEVFSLVFSSFSKPKNHTEISRIMTIEEIRTLPVAQLADKNCILFLWVTFPVIREAFTVIDAWGFTYKTVAFCWVKQNRQSSSLFWGMGHWTRANAELCLLATKGSPKRQSAGVHQIVMTPIEGHSKKPDIVRDKIISLAGDVPRIELFARQTTPGWDVWGNEVDSSISFP